jgi:hypothetical protein
MVFFDGASKFDFDRAFEGCGAGMSVFLAKFYFGHIHCFDLAELLDATF